MAKKKTAAAIEPAQLLDTYADRPPVNDVVMNVPANRGLKAAAMRHAARSGDSGLAMVVRKALCLYLNVDLAGAPLGIPAPPAGDDGEDW